MKTPSLPHPPKPPVQVVTVVEKTLATACPVQEVEILERDLVPSLPSSRTRSEKLDVFVAGGFVKGMEGSNIMKEGKFIFFL